LQRYLGNSLFQVAHVAGNNPVLQCKGIDREIPEAPSKGLFGSFELYFTEISQKMKGGLDGYILFTPSKDKRAPDSTKIGLVQIAKVVNDETGEIFDVTGKYPKLNLPKSIMTQEDKKKQTEAGFFVDKPFHEMEKGKPFSKYYIDRPERKQPGVRSYLTPEKKGTYQDQHGFKAGDIVKPAILTDEPQAANEATFSFETFAQSDSPEKYYGGVRWGFIIKPDPISKAANKHVSDGIFPPVIETTTVSAIYSLSPTASEAVERFEKTFQPTNK
jgi:hypothetical protein